MQFHDVEDGEVRRSRTRSTHVVAVHFIGWCVICNCSAAQVTHKLELEGQCDVTCLEWQSLAGQAEKVSAYTDQLSALRILKQCVGCSASEMTAHVGFRRRASWFRSE